ncbi:MAG: SDR family oxidoreductase, partial [Alphaproteobacteria bacterium]|nr:SDR family oxidoreductase [Alphaproteobacteria bacterium]
VPLAGESHYCASKGGVMMFTRAAALELAPHGIHVNALAPGMIVTRSARQRSMALSSSPLSSATRSSSAPAKSSSPRIARSVISAICGLIPA